jgi:hypothetical protein
LPIDHLQAFNLSQAVKVAPKAQLLLNLFYASLQCTNFTYRELNESEDEHGPEAAEVGVGEEAAEEGEEEYGADEVGHDVGGLRQLEVHLSEHVRDQVVPHRRDRHHLKRLDACEQFVDQIKNP